MQPLVLALVLGAAVLHASWNAFAKSSEDPLVRMAFIGAGGIVCSLPVALWSAPPDRASWPMLAGSFAVHQAYLGFLVLGYRSGDLSTVYPIARGSAPLLVAVGALYFGSEALTTQGVIGVVIISCGVASLALGREVWRGDTRHRRAVIYALCTGVTIAGYSIIDGIGGRRAGSVIGYAAWLNTLAVAPMVLFALWRRRERIATAARANWRGGLVGGAASALGYGLVIWAMSISPMGHVAALREVSVIIAAFIGTRLLGEPFGLRRMAAAGAVAAGIVLLQLSH